MRRAFRGYYPPSPEEFDKLWAEGLIVLDANALLNFFRYSASTRDELLKLLRDRQEQLWIPHQVGLEFHRRRHTVRGVVETTIKDIDKQFDDRQSTLVDSINPLKRNAKPEAEKLLELVETHATAFTQALNDVRTSHDEQ